MKFGDLARLSISIFIAFVVINGAVSSGAGGRIFSSGDDILEGTYSFDMSVDDITAGEEAIIEITDAKHNGYLLDGDFKANVTINNGAYTNEFTENFTFDEGRSVIEYGVLTASDVYTVVVRMSGDDRSDTLTVFPAEPDILKIDICDEINAGNGFEITIQAKDEYDNPVQTLKDFTIYSDLDGLIYRSDEIILDEEGKHTVLVDGNEPTTIGEHELYFRAIGDQGTVIISSHTVEVKRSWITLILYMFGMLGTLSIYGKELVGIFILLIFSAMLIYDHKYKISSQDQKKESSSKGKKYKHPGVR